jgi:hypothetical protein
MLWQAIMLTCGQQCSYVSIIHGSVFSSCEKLKANSAYYVIRKIGMLVDKQNIIMETELKYFLLHGPSGHLHRRTSVVLLPRGQTLSAAGFAGLHCLQWICLLPYWRGAGCSIA